MSAPLLFMLTQAPVIMLDGTREKKKEGRCRVLHSCDLFIVLKLENGAAGLFAYWENKCEEEVEHSNDCRGDEVCSRPRWSPGI